MAAKKKETEVKKISKSKEKETTKKAKKEVKSTSSKTKTKDTKETKIKKEKTVKKIAKNPDVAVEPVVAAEIIKQDKKTDKKQEPARYKNIGSYSAQIQNEFAFNNRSQAEEEDKTYRFMRKCKFDGEILVGNVIAIEDDKKKLMLGVRLSYEPTSSKNHYGMVEVLIPEQVFFEPGIKFSKDYDSKSQKEQYKIRKAAILQYQGAKIHFCVIGVSRSKTNNPNFPNQMVTSVIGDRVMAMEKLRDKYFFHKNRKQSRTEQPITIKTGDLVEAFVVNVNYQYVTVVSLGVETRIYLHDLTRENVSSCLEYTHVGDVLPECQVLNVEIKENRVQLRLTNNRSNAPKTILSMKKGSYYRGRVIWYNREKDIYTIALDNGVTAFVYSSNVMGYVQLCINDIVSVCVTSIMENKVGGNAVKI